MTVPFRFDGDWYKKTYPDVEQSGLDPLIHYQRYGALMGRLSAPDAPPTDDWRSPICTPTYLRMFSEVSGSLEAWAKRMRSRESRRLFAYGMSNGSMPLEFLESVLEALSTENGRHTANRILNELSPEWLGRFASVIASQSILDSDPRNALEIFRYIESIGRADCLTDNHLKKWFDLCFETSNRDEAARVFQLPNFSEKKFPYARADLLHPDYCAKSSQEEWLTVLSGIFTDNGLEPVSLLPPQAGLPLFDRLTAHANGIVKSGPLVSIVVSIWEPDEGLVTAIRSLLAQTWANIEILMVDDACAKEFRPLIERVAKMDPRIRLIRQETNMGTYMARNRAMQEARGEFITFHDADDWCHPRRIERQIQPMLENEHIMSTTSQTIRARENLLFSDLGSMTSIRLNSSSLMFRLDAVREKIGYFHASRKAADSEYIFRIQAAYGAGCRENVMDILSIIRIGTESLSGQDFWEGWRHPMRHQYRQSYEHWHSKIKGGNESGQLDVTDIGPISVPRRYCIGFSDQTVKQYKVVFVADWSGEDVACDHMSEELAARATEKQSIAVLNMASPRWLSFHARDKQRAIQSMINDKLIDEVSTMETLKARTVVITDPAIVQYCSTERSQWLVERVYVLNRADTTGVGTEALYDFRTVVDNIRKICGVKPEWIENIAQIGS